MDLEKQAKIQPPKNTLRACPICNSASLQKVIEFTGLPVLSNVLWDQREDALAAPRGDITLAFCATCGHVFNQVFDPGLMEYDVQYENSLHFSPLFQSYATWLAHYLVDKYNLHGKNIIEIGSGKGEFLSMLCDFGGNTGTGFDPSYDPAADHRPAGVSFVKELYSERHAGYQANLVLSRHVLEHIYQPAEFIQNLRRTIGNRDETVVFCEVPNFAYILRDTAIWDIIYEHYSYFSAPSLTEIFNRHGFRVMNIAEAFHGQFLYAEALPQTSGSADSQALEFQPVEVLANQVTSFASRAREKLARWEQQISSLQSSGKRAVLWGAGSKGISFLNMLPAQSVIEYIVDINPRKHNKYVTGAGQQIVPPLFLSEYRPDTIIIMNPVYQQEIQSTLDQMGLQAEFLLAS